MGLFLYLSLSSSHVRCSSMRYNMQVHYCCLVVSFGDCSWSLIQHEHVGVVSGPCSVSFTWEIVVIGWTTCGVVIGQRAGYPEREGTLIRWCSESAWWLVQLVGVAHQKCGSGDSWCGLGGVFNVIFLFERPITCSNKKVIGINHLQLHQWVL